MDSQQIMLTAQEWANTFLVWIGFGTLAGLLAKAIMPGRDPGGAVATLCMGIGGTVIGCGILSYFYEGQRISPISPIGFIVATAGAFIILAFYRLLAGYFFTEGETSTYRHHTRRRRSRRIHEAHVEE
ncbi:MAG: GlsB/YeaQ/YmgE family stress response membrane protein [Pirellulaceae bacterium]